ncbi:MAG: hypothetical protein ABIT01_10975 [Thermoanaerobaculia bacterium]
MENVRIVQQEVSAAAAMLDVLGEMAHGDEETLSVFSLAQIVLRGAERHAKKADRNAVHLVLPQAAPEPKVFGSSSRLEQAIADLTEHALLQVPAGNSATWRVEPRGAESQAILIWNRAPATRSERLFTLTRGAHGEPPNAGLFLARLSIESQGGTLTAEVEGDRVRAVATLPVASE